MTRPGDPGDCQIIDYSTFFDSGFNPYSSPSGSPCSGFGSYGLWYYNAPMPGGGGDGSPVDAALNKTWGGVLTQRLAKFGQSHCASVFAKIIPGFSVSGFVGAAARLDYYAPRSCDGSYTQNQVTGNGNNTTLGQTLPFGVDADTIWGSAGSAVLLGPNFFSNTSAGLQSNACTMSCCMPTHE